MAVGFQLAALWELKATGKLANRLHSRGEAKPNALANENQPENFQKSDNVTDARPIY